MTPGPAEIGSLRPIYQIMRRINVGADVRSVLEAVAEGVSHAVGFEVAAISYLTRDQQLEIVAVSGSVDAHDALIGQRTPLEEMEEELRIADQWGSLLFIPAERLAGSPASGWIPDLEHDPTAGPDRWRPEDTLRSPLCSPDGELLGILAVDLPIDGLRPDQERREMLEMYADLAGIALSNARRSTELEEQVRLSSAVDSINSLAAQTLQVDHIVDSSVAVVAETLGADTVWVRALGDGGTSPGHGARHPAGLGPPTPTEVLEVVARDAREAWAAGTVTLVWLGQDGVVGTSQRTAEESLRERGYSGPGVVDRVDRVPVAGGVAGWVPRQGTTEEPEDPERMLMVEFLRHTGAANLLLAPLGAGPDCLGYLVAVRAAGRPVWSPHEVHAADQIARNLGQAVLNARLLEREQLLVGQLEALDNYKSDLISTVSHELRTPLTSIAGHLELIEESPAEATPLSFRVVHRNLERVLSLIDDLLTLKKLADSDGPSSAGVVDLQAIAVDAAAAFRLRAAERGVTLTVLPSGGPLLISGDRDELERVALNLVGNAVKYTPAGGSVTVSAEHSERFVRLVCADTGIGISKRDQEELFTEFFRSTNPDALTQPGTGLGLSIVRRIVQRHGGSIRLESDLGAGSTFTVRLPLSRVSPTGDSPT